MTQFWLSVELLSRCSSFDIIWCSVRSFTFCKFFSLRSLWFHCSCLDKKAAAKTTQRSFDFSRRQKSYPSRQNGEMGDAELYSWSNNHRDPFDFIFAPLYRSLTFPPWSAFDGWYFCRFLRIKVKIGNYVARGKGSSDPFEAFWGAKHLWLEKDNLAS